MKTCQIKDWVRDGKTDLEILQKVVKIKCYDDYQYFYGKPFDEKRAKKLLKKISPLLKKLEKFKTGAISWNKWQTALIDIINMKENEAVPEILKIIEKSDIQKANHMISYLYHFKHRSIVPFLHRIYRTFPELWSIKENAGRREDIKYSAIEALIRQGEHSFIPEFLADTDPMNINDLIAFSLTLKGIYSKEAIKKAREIIKAHPRRTLDADDMKQYARYYLKSIGLKK